MGIFDKIKGILFDEEEVELPEIKKDTDKVLRKENIIIEEEENPIKEIKVPKEDFSDREHKTEATFTFPIDFDDEFEEVVEEPVKEVVKPKVKVEEKKVTPKRDYTDFLNRKEDKKQFKPTPIISPVYGVLDQNYKKEDVIVKKDILRRPNEITLEEVRKKAFGTLEDEIELNMPSTEEIVVVEEKKKEVIVEEPVDKMKTIGELIEEDSYSIDVPKLESINDIEEEHNNKEEIKEEPKNTFEDLIKDDIINLDDEEEKEEVLLEESEEIIDNEIDDEEADLFSLIDSMYEEKGE